MLNQYYFHLHSRYITIILSHVISGNSISLSSLRAFRVFRAFKTVNILPGNIYSINFKKQNK